MTKALNLRDDEPCPRCSFVHIVGIEVPGVYDGILYWGCPACNFRWHHWPDGHYLRPRAEPHVINPSDFAAEMP